jgi:hypothetical protein
MSGEKAAGGANHTIRTTDDEARALAQGLIRATASASLATLSADGYPLATLTSVAVDMDGSPLILVSGLSGHTTNLLRDRRVSLLFARTGKGDPLAHPRISVMGEAEPVARDSAAGARFRRRFLARQPKAQLYIDFPDFLFIRIAIREASLNGGFGKAYELTPADLMTPLEEAGALMEAEPDILSHMNDDHGDTVGLYATRLAKREPGPWRMVSLDPDGFEVAHGGDIARIAFKERLSTPHAAHMALVALAKLARAA